MTHVDHDGRVAVVTGAGGGLGRSHAMLLAARGARVVVNDLGSARDGSGAATTAADEVVEEIRAAGGEAVANHDGVETWSGGEAIVRTALEAYGRIDVVVNNAGILRDAAFANLGEEAFDRVVKVHLYGAFHVVRAAWSYFRGQGYGRIVTTSSGSGLYGNFGQANYAAAKLGLVGLTRTWAIEGARYGITANAIAPLARSRMTEDVMSEPLLELLQPEHVSGLVAFLGSEACTDSGHIYSVGGGYIARVAIVEGPGVVFEGVPSPEDIAAAWDQIGRVSGEAHEPTGGVMEQAATIARALARGA